jgi:hypothetical protein
MQSVLESFLILFSSNADDLKKGTEQAKKSVNELNSALDASNFLSEKAADGFNNLIKKASGYLTALVSVGAVIAGVKSATNLATQLGALSSALNVNVEELSAWSDAVKKSGGSAESFQQSATALTTALAEFATKGKSRVAPFFQQLGIRMVDAQGKARSFIDVLPELAGAFEKLNKQQAYGIGQKLGLDSGTITLLQQGRRAVEDTIRRQKELGAVTKEDAEIAKKFNNQWADTAHVFRNVFMSIATNVLPVLTKFLTLVDKAFTYIKNNKELFIGGILGIASALTAYLIPAIAKLGSAMLRLSGPLLILGALIALGALIYEDIEMYRQGHDSLIGEIEKQYPKLAESSKIAYAAWKYAWEAIIEGLTMVARFMDTMFSAIEEGLKAAPEAWKEFVDIIKSAWKSLVDFIMSNVNWLIAQIDKILRAFDKVKSALTFGDKKAKVEIGSVNRIITDLNASPFNAISAGDVFTNTNSKSSNSISVNVGDVTIETQSTDAQGIASIFSDSLETQIKHAISNFDDGVMI